MPNHSRKPASHQQASQHSGQNATHIASSSGQHASHPLPKSGCPGLALVGNPGAGKSTILNGFADKNIFKSGISLNSGMTTSLSKYQCERISLYDTPGLADVERKKKAGQELDKLLALDVPLKIAFVVTLESGRVRPDDSLTIELVLDAIKQDTDNRFGVVINQISKRVRQRLETSPEEEAKIRRSLTGKHSTSYWSYVDIDVNLMDESDGKLMTNELMHFFCFLPETKANDAHTVPIDTESMEDKREKHRALIKEIEASNAEMLRKMVDQMNTQKSQYAAQHSEIRLINQDLTEKLQKSQEDNARFRSDARRLVEKLQQGDHTAQQVQNYNQPKPRLPRNVGPGVAAALGIAAIPAVISPSLAHAYQYMNETRNGDQPTDGQNGGNTGGKPPSGLDGNEFMDGDPGLETGLHGEPFEMQALNNITDGNIDQGTTGQQYNQEYTDFSNATDIGFDNGFGLGGEYGW